MSHITDMLTETDILNIYKYFLEYSFTLNATFQAENLL